LTPSLCGAPSWPDDSLAIEGFTLRVKVGFTRGKSNTNSCALYLQHFSDSGPMLCHPEAGAVTNKASATEQTDRGTVKTRVDENHLFVDIEGLIRPFGQSIHLIKSFIASAS
jgi:hypothetical protein